MPGPFPSGGDFGLTQGQTEAVKDVLGRVARKKQALMYREMAASAAALGERRCLEFSDGNGGHVEMMVHPVSYHYWGNRLGYGCWQDAGFCREYLRDNPAARVKSRMAAPSVLVRGSGGLAAVGAKRFTKTYGAERETTDFTDGKRDDTDPTALGINSSEGEGKAQARSEPDWQRTPNAGARCLA